jgi:hypothetical protein
LLDSTASDSIRWPILPAAPITTSLDFIFGSLNSFS